MDQHHGGIQHVLNKNTMQAKYIATDFRAGLKGDESCYLPLTKLNDSDRGVVYVTLCTMRERDGNEE